MGSSGEAESDFYQLTAVRGKRSRIVLLLNLRHGLFCCAIYFQFNYIDIPGGLYKHIDETLGSAVFRLNVKSDKSGEAIKDSMIIIFISGHVFMQLVWNVG